MPGGSLWYVGIRHASLCSPSLDTRFNFIYFERPFSSSEFALVYSLIDI